MGVSKKKGVPQNGWFIMENLIKRDDLGVLHFRKHPYRDSKKPFIRIPINQPGFNGKQEGFLRGEKHLWLKADVQGTERQSWKLQPTRRLTQEDLKNTSAPWEEESKLKKCDMAKSFFFSALCLRELII